MKDPALRAACACASRLAGGTIRSVDKLDGGANNVVFRIDAGDRRFAAKIYFCHEQDQRDRLGTEFDMLSFLWRNNVRCIPEPLAKDSSLNWGLYQFVDGVRLRAGDVEGEHVGQLIELLGKMWTLREVEEATDLPNASDSAFSIQGHINRVNHRLNSICEAVARSNTSEELRRYVRDEVVPEAQKTFSATVTEARTVGIDAGEELSPQQRTLSPADHGFHNVIKSRTDVLAFLDFEYSGWDDPAQMIINACCQPEIPMNDRQQQGFIGGMVARLKDCSGLNERMHLLWPLLGLKWSLITLNSLLPVSAERRRFAGSSDAVDALAVIARSRSILHRLEGNVLNILCPTG